MGYIQEYLKQVTELIDQISEHEVAPVAELLHSAWKDGKRVLLLGNGGSSSTASHIVADLQKCIQIDAGKALKAMCLSDSTPLITAWANDTDYSNIFAQQVKCWAEPGDLLIAISGSGNSPNVIRAVETANSAGAATVGLAGFEGGKLATTASRCIIVRSDNMQQIEDVHMILMHLLFSLLRQRVKE